MIWLLGRFKGRDGLTLLFTHPAEVKSRAYPEPQHTYPMPAQELLEFEKLLESHRV